MAQGDYIAPGSAAVEAIDRFLTQREAAKARAAQTAHQLELDRIAIEREKRLEDEAKQAAEDRKAAREQAQKDKGYQQTEKRLDMMMPGDVPDPELVSDAQKYGLGFRLNNPRPAMGPDFTGPMNPTVTPSGPSGQALPPETPEMASVGGPVSNIGTPQQRQVQKREQYLDTLMAAPDIDAASKKALQYQRATGQVPPAGLFKLAGTATGEALIRVDPKGGKVEQFVDGQWTPLNGPIPEKAHWVTVPQGPRGSAATAGIETVIDPKDQKAIDMFAKQVATGKGWPPLGSGTNPQVVALRKAISRRAADYDPATDTFSSDNASPDIGANRADFDANRKALDKVVATQAAVDAFAGAAERNGAALEKTLDSLPDTGIEWLNSPWRSVEGALRSNPAVKDFQVFRESLNKEYAKLLNSANLTGSATNAMNADMKVIMSPNSTIANIRRALADLKTEAKNRHDSYAEEIKGLRSKIGTGGGNSGSSTTTTTKKRTYYDSQGNVIPEPKK